MKKIIVVLYLAITSNCYGQDRPSSGNYTTEDGLYTINVSFADNTIKVQEPNKTTTYNLVSGKEYKYVNGNGVDYRLEIINSTTLNSFHANNRSYKTKLVFTGELNDPSSSDNFIDYKAKAEEYKEKMKTDPKDAQAWAFCAAAAMARATMNADGFDEYVRKIILQLKTIVVDKNICPCAAVIPISLWNNTQ